MCGRFTQKRTWEELHRLYRLTQPARNTRPQYNICPTDPVDVNQVTPSATTVRGTYVPVEEPFTASKPERMRGVGVEEAAAVGAQNLDGDL
jgi:putative SOS response-associated peptidase YedK